MSFSFSFKTYYNHDARFNINGVQYDVKVSSNMVDEQQGRIMDRQVITLMKNTAGVNMVRKETMMEDPEFLLTGVGLMENASEEELKSFASEWKRLMQKTLGAGEAHLLFSMDRFLGLNLNSNFSELLDHFCPDLQNE